MTVPKGPLPAHLENFVRAPRAAVVATVRSDGTPVTAATWYDWEDGRVLLSMASDGHRLRRLRSDPRVALTILGDSWYQHVSILGRAVTLRADPNLADLDRLARRYTGKPWPSRSGPITSAVIEIDTWHTYGKPGRDRRPSSEGRQIPHMD